MTKNNTMIFSKNRSIPKPDTPLTETGRVVIRSAEDFDIAMQNRFFTLTNILLGVVIAILVWQAWSFSQYVTETKEMNEFLRVRHEVLGNKVSYLSGKQDEKDKQQEKQKEGESEENGK